MFNSKRILLLEETLLGDKHNFALQRNELYSSILEIRLSIDTSLTTMHNLLVSLESRLVGLENALKSAPNPKSKPNKK